MKRRIYRNFLGLILPVVLLLSVLLSFFFYNAFKSREMVAVRDSATLIADFMNRGVQGEVSDYISGGSLRITIIATDGTVLLDNLTDAGTLENHGTRAEIQHAIQTGTGEAIRYSNTLRAETYYYAVRLNDGSILRLSKTIGNITGVFSSSIPAVLFVTLLILILANVFARRLTKSIISPISDIDFDGENEVVYDELLPYVKKIGEQKHRIAGQIAALQNRADTIAAITENMKEGLILLDSNGLVLTANKSVSGILGEMKHGNILHICRDAEFGQGVRRCLAGNNAEILFVRGGKQYNVYFSPVHGDSGGAIVLFFDVTAQRDAEQQRREFSANVSHELKTPLTSISALSEMIVTGMAKDNDINGFAARISEQAGRLINIIEDIIKLSEFDEGRVGKENECIDLYALVETTADALRENEKGVEIHITGERYDISANRRMIDELLYNLIDNGIKYNKDGGTVTIALSRENGLCKISVSDTGIGIPSEHHDRIFERFYRVDKSHSKKTGGTGLGLAIVKHIVEHHGGRVVLESEVGVGTTVTCWITTRL